ncbi:MAG: hypothetical protein ACK40C_09480 [Novosphingobium meiothermophilum]
MSRPLTETEIRDVIRAHPDAFLMVSRLDPSGDIGAQMGDIIAAAPEALAQMIMHGLDLSSFEEVRALGFLGCCTAAVTIASLTQRTYEPETLALIFTSELARIVSRRTPAARLSLVEGGRA